MKLLINIFIFGLLGPFSALLLGFSVMCIAEGLNPFASIIVLTFLFFTGPSAAYQATWPLVLAIAFLSFLLQLTKCPKYARWLLVAVPAAAAYALIFSGPDGLPKHLSDIKLFRIGAQQLLHQVTWSNLIASITIIIVTIFCAKLADLAVAKL